MKRCLSALIAMLLCLSCLALGEEPELPVQEETPPPTFCDSLLEWAAGLDPSSRDLSADFSMGSETYSALLRSDGDRTEFAIADFFTLQFDRSTVLLDAGGQTYALDLEPILRAFNEARRSGYELSSDGALLSQLLERAVQVILLPSVTYAVGYSGITLHIKLSNVELQERLDAFIDEAIMGDAAERLFARYGQYLRALIPGCPSTMEELRQAWSENGHRSMLFLPPFTIEGDAQFNDRPWREPEVSCVLHITHAYGQSQFSFDYAPTGDGFSLGAGLSESSGFRSFSCAASLDGHGDTLTGTLLIDDGEVSSLHLNARFSDNGLDGDVTCHKGGALLWTTSFYLLDDPQAHTLTGEVTHAVHAYGSGIANTVASLNVHYWDGGCSGSLYLPNNSLHFRALSCDSYVRILVKTQPTSEYISSDSVDLWFFRQGWDGYRVRLDASQSMYGRLYRQVLLSGAVDSTGISFEYSDPLRDETISGSAHYVEQSDGFDFGVELLTDAQRFYQYTGTQKVPFSLQVRVSAQECEISFSNTSDMETARANARFGLAETGDPTWLEVDYELGYALDPRDTFTGRLTWEPGKLVVTGGDAVYTLEKRSEAEREISYQLYTNQDDAVYNITLSLDDALQTFSGRVDVEGYALAELRIAASDSTAITPFDAADTIPVDLALIMDLLSEAQPADEPSAPALAEEAVEEAVEEAASNEG
uniref:Uncharacterized protein n=1 Tax=uncultured bacterium Contig575 TaxID=1393592 RepID=W0FLK5_9BACT|nr:hypothetical protein [uncultured bacterium Contig575]